MPWESRPGGRYYYSARRVGGRVIKTYYGRGILGAEAARLDAVALPAAGPRPRRGRPTSAGMRPTKRRRRCCTRPSNWSWRPR